MTLFLLIWIIIPFSDAMEVKTNVPETRSLLGRDISLDCHFLILVSIKLEEVAVKWEVGSGSSIKSVYMFDGITEKNHRDRITLDLLRIEEGNASLQLMNVTLEDEGIYTCTVLIAPDVGTATVKLKVAGQPSVALAPLNPRLSQGESKTFFCEASQFYPQELEISWLLKRQGKEVPLTTNICTGIPLLTDSGMFSVGSQISMTFNEKDDGVVYICEIKHESLPWPARWNTTLLLATPQITERDTSFIVGVVASTILITIVVCMVVVIVYQKKFAKAPQLVLTLMLPKLVPAHENMIAMCNINGFRPKVMSIEWYLQKKTCDPGSDVSPMEPLLSSSHCITCQSKTKHRRSYNTTSQLSYVPTIHDDGASIVCEVKQKALQTSIQKAKKINITARPQKCCITCWPQVPRLGEMVKLSCIVEKFYPQEITLTWLRNGELVTDVTQFGPFLAENDCFTVWSQVGLLLRENDDGLTYTCRINHQSLGTIEELSYEINLNGSPPKVNFITATPPNPTIGQDIQLRCEISNFSPTDITVEWLKNNIQLNMGISNSPCVASSKGVYSMWSFLNITPQAEDDNSVIRCRVQHIALRDVEERSYVLRLPKCADWE